MNETAILSMIDGMLADNFATDGDPESQAYWEGYDDSLRKLKGWIESGAQL